MLSTFIGGNKLQLWISSHVTTKSIGEIMTIEFSSRSSKENESVKKSLCWYASSKNTIIQDIISSPLVTIDAISQVQAAADVMLQNKVRHLLVVKDNGINKPLGIITPNDFTGYLKENLNIDDVNAKIIEYLKEESISEHQLTTSSVSS